MSTQETRAVVHRLFELGNAKDTDAYIDMLHEEFVNHSAPPGIPDDREGYRQIYGMYVNALPDFHILMGVPPTGNTVETTGITINRVADGKIIEQWEIADMATLMQQIGAMPGPET